MPLKHRLLTGVSLAAMTALPAAAQDFDLGEIVVIDSLESAPVTRSGAIVDVLTSDDLSENGETGVLSQLARLPGVSVRTNGPLGSVGGLTIRGVSQNNIAVRLDGIDIADPSGTQVAYDFGGLLAYDIGRIEVLKGSQSAIYGSEAMGGVVNMATRQIDGTEMTLELGSYDTFKAGISHGVTGADGSVTVNVTHMRTDGYSAADENDGNEEADGFEATRLSLAGRAILSSDAALAFSAFTENATFDYDEFGPSDGTPDEVTERTQSGARLALELTGGAIDHTFEASTFVINRRQTGSNFFGPFDFEFDGSRQSLGYQGAVDVSANLRTVFGLERTIEVYDAFGSKYDTKINAAFGEVDFAATPDLDIALSARVDDRSDFGQFWTGRIAAVYRVTPEMLVRGSLSNGFRAPSSYELFDTFSGNEDLEPETSRSAELGLEKVYGDRARAGITLFRIEADDIIDYSFTDFGYVQRDGQVTRQGIEVTGEAMLSDAVTLAGSYTWTDSDSEAELDSSGWLASTPEHSFALALDADVTDRIGVTLTALHETGRGDLDDYTLLGAAARYDLGSGAEAYLRIENLTDAEYQTVPGYGTSDSAVFAGIRATF